MDLIDELNCGDLCFLNTKKEQQEKIQEKIHDKECIC